MLVFSVVPLIAACCIATADKVFMDDRSAPCPATPVTSAAGQVDRETTVRILQPIGILVGEWKGVGQPRRGSNAGAWSEKAQAAWQFHEERAVLVMTLEPGQQFHLAAFSVADDSHTPDLMLTTINGDSIYLTRAARSIEDSSKPDDTNDSTWIFESAADQFPQARCTVRLISEVRITILFEERQSEKSAYRRVSEIGMTRAGARLASGNTGERQCIVTGGLGTIKVTHEGKTYYVCCEGCQQAFDADPAGTVDAYRKRLSDEAK